MEGPWACRSMGQDPSAAVRKMVGDGPGFRTIGTVARFLGFAHCIRRPWATWGLGRPGG
jgi:hypothetical protein